MSGFAIFDVLERRADLGPERVAMHELAAGGEVTYFEMHERAGRSAALLADLGVAAGDRVALLCRNRIEFFEILFACARIEAIQVPLNWRMPPAELDKLLADCGARCLLYGKEDAPSARALGGAGLVRLGLDDDGDEGYAARRDAMPAVQRMPARHPDDTWYLLYTSGTTGRPKAVINTFGMAMANYVNISQGMALRGDDTTLCFLPLFHSGGINLTALPMLFLGARLLITAGFDVERTVELIDAARLDTFFGVPAVYQAISLHERFDALDLGSVRRWGCGGAPLPDDMFRRFAGRGATVLNGMGMTETGPTAFLMDPRNAHRKIGSVGKPQLLCAVRLVDADGQDVPPGEIGEIWFAGAGVTPGYYKRPGETAAARTADGWLKSGDMGCRDEDGYYYIAGRLKDMYISGGENVYPAEIENELAAHPDVLEAAVTGVPDERWGEVGCAWLLARHGRELPADTELAAWLRQRLAAYKVPKYFVMLEAFPRTAAGKVQKHLLRHPGKEVH